MKSQELRRPMPKAEPAACCANTEPHTHTTANTDDKPHTDPVCGMKAAAHPEKSATHLGKIYYFCSMGCVTKFKADPEHYLSAVKKNAMSVVIALFHLWILLSIFYQSCDGIP